MDNNTLLLRQNLITFNTGIDNMDEMCLKGLDEISKREVTIGNEYELGIRLQELLKKKNYDAALACFDKLHLREGYNMKVLLYDPKSDEAWENAGAPSYVIITASDGETYRNTDEAFWKCFSVKNTIEAIWQAVLLYNLWYYLPMYWHAAYERRDFIYTQEQLQELQRGYRNSKRAAGFSAMVFDVVPRIWIDEEGTYYAMVCYWTIFGGLLKSKYLIITHKEENYMSITEYGAEHLYSYRTGIML